MITREDLENAALAAGVIWIDEGGKEWCVPSVYRDWNPHTDDGDMGRLAARLLMNVDISDSAVDVRRSDMWGWYTVRHNGTEPDKMRAMREAVVLCAVPVGKKMRASRGTNATPGQVASQAAAIEEFDAAKLGER